MKGMIWVLLAVASVMSMGSAAVAGDSFDHCTGFIDSVPATINKQGTWCLRKDLSTNISSGSVVTIVVNNVTINCKDHKLGGLAAGPATLAIGVFSTSQNVTVRQCNIRGFFAGVALRGMAGGHLVENNRFDGNTRMGLQVDGDGSMVRNNIIGMTGGSTDPTFRGRAEGIYVAQGDVDILDNTISGVAPESGLGSSSALGIEYDFGSGVISGNRIRGLAPDTSEFAESIGVNLSDHGSVLVVDNHVVGAGGFGYGVLCSAGSHPAVVKDNTVDGFQAMHLGCVDAGGNYFAE